MCSSRSMRGDAYQLLTVRVRVADSRQVALLQAHALSDLGLREIAPTDVVDALVRLQGNPLT